MPRKVLIGYDGTPHGEDALELGRQLAEALDASALVATVVRHPRHGVEESKFDAAVAEHCEAVFSIARERLAGIEMVEHPMINSSRSAALYELTEWEQPSLIVIASTHRGRVGWTLLGSLGHSLLSGVPTTVAIAPRGYAEGERRLDRIGVAIDGSSEGWRALKAASVMAASAKEPLRLLNVMPPPHYALGGLLSPLSPEQYREFKEREAEEILRDARGRLDSNLSVETKLLHGAPAEEIASASDDLDLLIVGSRAHGPVTGALLGSVSAKLMSSAPCPVMVLARGAGGHPLER